MREGYVFYRAWNDAIQMLPEEFQLAAYKSIMDYALKGIEPEVNGIVTAIFIMAKPIIDKNEERAANGSKGGRPTKSAAGAKKSNADVEKPYSDTKETTGLDNKNHRFPTNKPTETVTETDTGTDTVPPVAPPARSLMDHIMESDLSDPVKDKLADYIRHRAEMGQPYTPTALQSLIHEVRKREQAHGARAVIDAIDVSVASGYKGIVWDRIGLKTARARPISSHLDNNEFDEAAKRIDAGGTAFNGWAGGGLVS